MSEHRPWVIGIIGGIGSGKSALAHCFADLGATVIDADLIAHEVLDLPEIREKVRATWGNEVFDEKGTIIRGTLADRVFDDAEALDRLVQILHPPIIERIRTMIRSAHMPVVVDAALLLESSLSSLCDYLVFVESDLEKRRARTVAGRGWAPDEVVRRERFQMSLQEKRNKADFVLVNNGSLEELKVEAVRIWDRIRHVNRANSESAVEGVTNG